MGSLTPFNMEFILQLREITVANLSNENFGVNELAKATGLNYFSLNRKLHSAIKKTVSQFITEIRLEKAKELLEQKDHLTASEVAFKVGFGSPAYFNRCFHERFGYPPGEIKKRGSSEQKENSNEIPSISGTTENPPIIVQDKQPIPKKLNRKTIAFAATGFLILAVLSVFYVYPVFKNSTLRLKPADKSIAVLPFKNLSDDPNNQYFADGVMEDILNHLYQIRERRVISRTSVEQFRENTKTAPEIAKKLGVSFILEGSVLQYDDKVRIMVQLIDARNDRYILTEQYDRDFKDILSIQSTIAKQVAEKLEAVLTIKEKEKIEKILTQNEEAYRYYLLGRYSISRRMGEKGGISDGLNNGLKYFNKSAEIDPGYPLAYAGLAETYYLMAYWGEINPPSQGFEKAVEYANKALDLDPDLAEAHTVLGRIYTLANWKWEEARKEFLLAIKENPNNPFLHANYADLLDILGEDKAAREQIDKALKLEPTISNFHKQSADYYFNEGKLTESLEEVSKLLEIQPDQRNALWLKSYIYDRLNDDVHAIETLKKILKIDVPETDYSSMIDSAYQKEGPTGVYKLMLEYLRPDPNYSQQSLAQVYARLGMRKEAIECLQRSLERKEIRLPRINNDARLVYIRKEPEFREIINKMGLGPYFNPDKDFSPVAD
jgi:TolB-like protein/AraC-like DNA-binding protein/Tfp pilus assembly protein PilF